MQKGPGNIKGEVDRSAELTIESRPEIYTRFVHDIVFKNIVGLKIFPHAIS